MNENDQDENPGTPRAGGDVSAKSASQGSTAESRAGGPVITKGPSHKADTGDEETDTRPTPDQKPGTRAGGPVITKGPSQKQQESSQ